MPTATRLDTNLAHWIPVARHYQVDGGYLVVVAANFFTAKGTDVFYSDENAGPFSMQAIAKFPDGTTHDEALANMGYTVVDNIVDQPVVVPVPDPVAVEQSVLDMLPPEIAGMVASAVGEIPPENT
jgi:hypothetical protein